MDIDFKSIASQTNLSKYWSEEETALIKKAIADGCKPIHAKLLSEYFPRRNVKAIKHKLIEYSK